MDRTRPRLTQKLGHTEGEGLDFLPMDLSPVKDAYRIDEVAELFRVDPRTVYRWLQRVILTATRRRVIRWIAYSDIDRFL